MTKEIVKRKIIKAITKIAVLTIKKLFVKKKNLQMYMIKKIFLYTHNYKNVRLNVKLYQYFMVLQKPVYEVKYINVKEFRISKSDLIIHIDMESGRMKFEQIFKNPNFPFASDLSDWNKLDPGGKCNIRFVRLECIVDSIRWGLRYHVIVLYSWKWRSRTVLTQGKREASAYVKW